jgi:hypothetical protein
LDLAGLRLQCERLAGDDALVQRFSWQDGFDDHAFVTLMFKTNHPKRLWNLLHQQLYQASAVGRFMQASSIAICEGRHGWEDYLLLHHFDAGERCDDFSEGL